MLKTTEFLQQEDFDLGYRTMWRQRGGKWREGSMQTTLVQIIVVTKGCSHICLILVGK